MITEAILLISIIIIIILVLLIFKKDWKKYSNISYYEITLFLGSGGHTGELCAMLEGFYFQKTSKINILISSSDKSSENYFRTFLKRQAMQKQKEILPKIQFYYLKRTNQVKQSLVTSVLTTILSFINIAYLIAFKLINTTHLIANGPGTCVPLFYIYYLLNKIKISRAKLIFVESWCRVKDLSLSGKLIRPIADKLLVHWPELAAKYRTCTYYEGML